MSASSDSTLSVLPASLPIAARVLFKLLGSLRHGRITATLPDKSRHEFGNEMHGIHARIDYDDGQGSLLNTHISGTAQPLTRANLRRAALRFPLQTLAVVARIHWHALRLFAKRVPFFGKLRSNMTGISRS